MSSEIKRLLPLNISSGAYILKEARKINKSKNDLSIKSLNESIVKNNIPIFDGKIYDPTIYKTINKLKKDEDYLIKELTKINSNEKLLKSKSYINLFNNNPHNISNDQQKINDKIKNLQKYRNIYLDKLGEVKIRINTLQYNAGKELGIIENIKKMKYNKFIEDYNTKKSNSLIEIKIKKMRDENEKIHLMMKKDLKKQIDKKNNELNEKEKKEEEKREALLKKMHDEEREDIEKRKKKNSDNLLKLKENIHQKPKEKIYLYQKKIDKYLNDENNLIKLENLKRKALMKHIDSNEFNEMRKNYEQLKSKKALETNLKIENIKKSWAERHKLVPLYINPLSKLVTEEDKKIKQEEKNKILKAKNLKTLQKNYSKEKIPKPIKKITDKIAEKENENENNKAKMIRPYFIKSNSYSNIIREKIIKNYKERLKNKSIQEKISEGNKEFKIRPQSPIENIKNQKVVNDYLKERRKIKEKRKSFTGLTNIDNEIKYLINNKGIDENTLKMAKFKLDSIEEKTKQRNMLLKYSGGVANKPELGNEVCDLMIDTIQAKLSLIKGIDKNLNENLNEEKSDDDDGINNNITDENNISEKTEENLLDNEY